MEEEHPLDKMRTKAMRWQRHNKLAGNETMQSYIKKQYGAIGAANLLRLIDYVANETAKMIILSEPKEFKEVNGKKALIVPEKKFKIITQLAGIDMGGMKIRHHQTAEYIKADDTKGIVPNPKGKGILFLTSRLDIIEWQIEREIAEKSGKANKN